MKFVFKFSSIIYRIILFLTVPFAIVANFLVGAAGHNISFKFNDYLLFAFAIMTATSLTIYESSENEIKVKRKHLYPFVVFLVLTSIVVQIYFQIDTIFVCHCFIENGALTNSLFLTLILVSFLVLIGLILNKKRLRKI